MVNLYKNVEPRIFRPKHPEKYVGDVNNIVARSGLELRYMNYFDSNPNVKRWMSEEIYIPYISPVDGKRHRYFVDLMVETIDGKVFAIEIKPNSKKFPPKQGKNKKRYLMECAEYAINQAKWAAAEKYFSEKGIQFIVVGEKEISTKW